MRRLRENEGHAQANSKAVEDQEAESAKESENGNTEEQAGQSFQRDGQNARL